jgi:hypothetical protein
LTTRSSRGRRGGPHRGELARRGGRSFDRQPDGGPGAAFAARRRLPARGRAAPSARATGACVATAGRGPMPPSGPIGLRSSGGGSAQAQEQLRELGNGGRHLHRWFERYQSGLARGLAAELTLGAASSAVHHVLGAPGIASLTAACPHIRPGDRHWRAPATRQTRRRYPAATAVRCRSRALRQGTARFAQRTASRLDGEDLDRVLEAIALVKRRNMIAGSPDNLWIRAAEPEP